ncbi:MAG: cobalamin B12-binding domain-containing protein, partial [Syntrophaceae bacterium]|nr:cobalamin B12-binding domain-containing protein [Syntrophaceae bacterium]
MKILLINPMASRKPPVKGRGAHFPIGLGLIAATLNEHGFSVTVLDNETECLNKYELREFISSSEYDVYGISAMAPQYSYVKGLSRMIKELKNRPIILGGPLGTYSYEAV